MQGLMVQQQLELQALLPVIRRPLRFRDLAPEERLASQHLHVDPVALAGAVVCEGIFNGLFVVQPLQEAGHKRLLAQRVVHADVLEVLHVGLVHVCVVF